MNFFSEHFFVNIQQSVDVFLLNIVVGVELIEGKFGQVFHFSYPLDKVMHQ
jgi:hypothetical protein